MSSKELRKQLTETTDEQLRYEFLRLIAKEERQHFMQQIAEDESSKENAILPFLQGPDKVRLWPGPRTSRRSKLASAPES